MHSIFLVLSLLGCICVTNAIRCYVCNSGTNPGCGDPFDRDRMNNTLTFEFGTNGVCTKGKVENGDSVTVLRGGSPTDAACVGGRDGCKSDSDNGVSATVCCCTTELCNSALTLRNQPVFFMIIIAITMFIYRKF